MTDQTAPKQSPDDAAFARSIAEIYAPPPMSAATRSRFDARLAERVASRGVRSPRRIAALAVATAAAVGAVLAWVPLRPEPDSATGRSDRGEVILALAFASGGDADADLPDDYRAISALLAE